MSRTPVPIGRSFVEEEYERAAEAIPHGDMFMPVYEAQRNPFQHHGHVALDTYLSSNSESLEPVERMTGRMADLNIPTGGSSLTGESDMHHFSVVDLRAAPGSVFLNFAQALHESGGNSKRPWFFSDLDGATQLYRHAKTGDGSERWDHVASIGDDHPINELPIFMRPKPHSTVEHEIAYGCPAAVVGAERAAMVDEDLTYDKVKHGLALKERMVKEGVTHPIELGGKVKQSDVNAYRSLPQERDVVNYVWRAFQLARFLENSGFKKALNSEAIEGLVMDTVAYARALEKIMRTGRLLGRVGILDIKDVSMKPMVDQLFGDNIDLEDPNVRKKVHGSLYFRQHRQTAAPVTYSDVGSDERTPIKGFKLFLDSDDAQKPYKGFRDLQEVVDEMTGKTPPKGGPKMPVSTLLHIPTSITESTSGYGEHLMAINPFRAPGAFMEAFLASAPWVVKHYTQEGANYTIEDVLKGNFAGSTAGTPAAMLARSAFGLINRSGDTTDNNGARTGYRVVTPIPRGSGVAINVAWPKASADVKISSGALTPEQPKKIPAISKRAKSKKEGKLAIGRGHEPNLSFGEVSEHVPVASIFVDAEHRLFVRAYSEEHNKGLPDHVPPVPVPSVVVAASKPPKAGRK